MSISAWRRRADLSSRRADARERHAGWRRACRCTGCGRFRRSTTARRSCAFIDPDTLEIIVTGGRQRLRNQKEASAAGLQIRGGRMRITGIMQPHQIGVIDADVAGSLPDALALLREPRLGLARPPSDRAEEPGRPDAAKLSLVLPLEDAVRMDDIAIQVQAHLDGVHLGALVAGRDLDQGVLDLTANAEGMKLSGRALLASIPAKLDAAMDFRAGPPSQVLQSVTVSGQPDARQLAAAGLDATSLMNGAGTVAGGAERAAQRPGRCRGHRRSDRRGAGRGTARMAQAARRPGKGVGARAAGPRPADRHRGRPARRRGRRPARARGLQRRQAVGCSASTGWCWGARSRRAR